MTDSFGFVGKSFGLPSSDAFSRSDRSGESRALDRTASRNRMDSAANRADDFETSLKGAETASMASHCASDNAKVAPSRDEPVQAESAGPRPKAEHQTSTDGVDEQIPTPESDGS